MNKAWMVLSACICALLLGAPVFGTQYQYLDPNEPDPSTDGYDLQYIRIDDHDGVGSNLTVEYTTWASPLLIVDGTDYVNITMWLDLGGFDQDPGATPMIAGFEYDFEIRWYGDDFGVSGTAPYDLEFVVLGQDGTAIYTSGANTAIPVGDTLTLQVPWAQLVDSIGGEALPGHTMPSSFQFLVQFDNDHLNMADDIFYVAVPEPLTMLGLFMGLGGVGTYIRRRRMA